MRIYRIENAKGDGPYTSSHDFKYELQNAHQNDALRPGVRDDIIEFDRNIHICGFQKYGHMNTWFDGWLDKLKSQGFKLVKYKVSQKYVLKGTGQLVFKPNKAKLISTREIK